MTKTLTVEGDMSAVDTIANLITQGSITTPSLTIPAGVSKIERIIVSCVSDGLADGGSTFLLRLGGGGVLGGEQTIIVGAHGRIAVQSGSDAAPAHVGVLNINDVDIAVRASDPIKIQAEMMSTDTGTAGMVVTLVFA